MQINNIKDSFHTLKKNCGFLIQTIHSHIEKSHVIVNLGEKHTSILNFISKRNFFLQIISHFDSKYILTSRIS